MFRFLVLIAGAIAAAHAHIIGAPTSACNDMLPGHGVPPQTKPSPYRITISKDVVRAGEEVKVSLEGIDGEKFKGFILEARAVGDAIVGTFRIDPSNASDIQIMDCPGGTENAVTHKNADDKPNVSVKWVAPEDFDGKIVFKATFVKDRLTFWVGQESTSITVEH